MNQNQALKNIGAICVLGYNGAEEKSSPDDEKKYKIIYTKNCMSQVRKHYDTDTQKVKVELYKYCFLADVKKIRESLKLYRINKEDKNNNWFFISLDVLFDHLLEYFEPDLF